MAGCSGVGCSAVGWGVARAAGRAAARAVTRGASMGGVAGACLSHAQSMTHVNSQGRVRSETMLYCAIVCNTRQFDEDWSFF